MFKNVRQIVRRVAHEVMRPAAGAAAVVAGTLQQKSPAQKTRKRAEKQAPSAERQKPSPYHPFFQGVPIELAHVVGRPANAPAHADPEIIAAEAVVAAPTAAREAADAAARERAEAEDESELFEAERISYLLK